MITKIQRLILCAWVGLMAVSCSADKGEYEITKTEESTTVRFTLSVPGAANPQTSSRSLTDAEEEAVSSVDVLVFYTDGQHSGKLYRREQAAHISGKTFEVKLPEGTYDLVVLANAGGIIDNTPGLIPQTVTKTDAVASLVHSNPDGYWTDTTIPMWGYKDGVLIDESTSLTGNDAVDMHRMTVKIEVRLSPVAAGTDNDNFALTSVRLYNYNTKGRVAPDMANFNPTGGIVNAGKGITTAATVPPDRGAVTGADNPLIFEAAEGVTPDNLLNTIYTFEALKGTAATPSTNPCLVIGGSYLGDAPTYYRVDFVKKSGDTYNWVDLLRNHRYMITINSVAGKGYETPQEAFNARSFNMEVDIVAWEEGDMTETDFNGNYQLSVNKTAFFFYDEGRAQTMKIYTDYPLGWKIEDKPSWITVDPESDDSGTSVEVTVEADQIPSNQEDRDGSFYIVAGTFRRKISVEQVNEPELTLTIDEQYLYFNKSAGQPKSIRVTTYPDGIPIYFSEVGGDISWRSGGHPNPTEYGGSGLYTFHPAAITSNPALQRTSSFSVMVMQGTKRVTRIVEIIQKAVDLMFDWNPKNAFAPEAGQRTITVTSDTDWYVDGTDGTTAMFASQPVSTLNQPGVTNYVLNLTGNDTWQTRTARLLVKSNDLDFPGDYITISQGAKVPEISIDKSGTYDISGANVTVAVTSNAKWTFSGDSHFANTATSAPYGTSSDTPLSTVGQGGVTFIKKAWPEAGGTPAAGTSYTSTVTFTTTATGLPSGVNQAKATQNFQIKSTVPGFWKAASIPFAPASGATISSTEQTKVTIKANTNAKWTATPTAGNAASQGPTAYDEKTIEVYIPIYNNGWGNRSVTVNVANEANTTKTSATYQQKGYYVNTSGHSAPTSISVSGGQQTISVNGWYPGSSVQVRASGAVTAENTITGSAGTINGAGNASAQVTVGANNNWSSSTRSIQFQYRYLNNGTSWTNWTNIGNPVNQPGAYSNNTPTLNSSTIAGGGQTIRVTVSGTYPDGWIQVQAYGTGMTTVSGTTNSSKYVDIKIPNNTTGSPRNVTFQYRRRKPDGTWEGWTTIGSAISQPKGSLQLTSGRIVAQQDATVDANSSSNIMYWATAMGLDPTYNTNWYYPNYSGRYENETYAPNKATGCNAYSESGYPAGTWRVPTKAELLEMGANRAEIPNLNSGNYYCSEEIPSEKRDTWTIAIKTGTGLVRNEKTGWRYVRCVRAQ